jgi:hypothetical protein
MPNRETYNTKSVVTLRPPTAITATGTSNYVDTIGFDSVLLLVSVGDLGSVDASNLLTFEVQEATATPASASSYSQVAAAELDGDIDTNGEVVIDAAGDESKTYAIAYLGDARYLRVVYTETGTISGNVAVIGVLENSSREPASGITPTTGTVS